MCFLVKMPTVLNTKKLLASVTKSAKNFVCRRIVASEMDLDKEDRERLRTVTELEHM